nr:39S ribosomal protein L46, mitochondrial [Megalopta genalis]XP_033321961.1 39S ribosomal protein L46, mitochondrial [Megalopta genalis]XP_033321962.1 39S ribosomal protein L46, mitochondrial [Megalopta genalis]XP_033321963.1 39S ribosomal protein L46, mitochondrial [Megalopta genalis]
MLKRILMFHALKNAVVLSRGTTSSTAKIIFRGMSQVGIEIDRKWDLFGAVCLERHPIITKPMEDVEARYQEMLKQIELENSLISDFEIQMKQELKHEWKIGSTDESKEKIKTQTLQDIRDSYKEELMKFQFASRTNAEEDDQVTSLNRKLDKTLVLLVNERIGTDNFWIPPQTVHKCTETMIETARRTVEEFCGNNIGVQFYGNAPIGFYTYKYPKQLEGKDGAKIFYFLAKYINGDISSKLQHCWLDREELEKIVHPRLYRSLSQFLLPE